MCGILGFASSKYIEKDKVQSIMNDLLVLSESRGKEAAGVAIFKGNKASVYKRAMMARKMISTKDYKQFFQDNIIDNKGNKDEGIAAIGHSRLVTNGTQFSTDNNQPVVKDSTITVHNGIIVNVDKLWEEEGLISHKKSEVDTEVFTLMLQKYKDPISSTIYAYSKIYGVANTLNLFCDKGLLVAATNNGSLYSCLSKDEKSIILASEKLTLMKLIRNNKFASDIFLERDINQIESNTALLFELKNSKRSTFLLNPNENIDVVNFETKKVLIEINKDSYAPKTTPKVQHSEVTQYFDIDLNQIRKLKRCTCCVLPETMPFIKFDDKGVCNYCHNYKKQQYMGKQNLDDWANKQKNRYNGKKDSVVAFSGGRDSSFGLHYFVKELGLNPVCFTYDWGMVTDLARRNQSRMCASLGVELVIISADLRKKRDNIRRNVNAWLKKPDLGMIPIFMAGDKQYFYYANQICKDFGLDTILLAANPFEETNFKTGFCGVKPNCLTETKIEDNQKHHLGHHKILRMGGHYISQYLRNPSYINRSILDTAWATVCFYGIPHNYFRLFDFIPWDETTVNDVLRKEYDWELSPDTETTWRIGDGTAPFYNYIYYKVAGFTENDTLRSNQIREGMISRDEAIKLIERDNAPRFESMRWYFETIGVDMVEALKVIDKIPKLFRKE